MNRLGWFGRLALSNGLPPENPQRESVMVAAHRALWLVLGGFAGALGGVVVGLGLLIFLLIMLHDGKLRRQYCGGSSSGGVFLEAFAIYVVGLAAAELGVEHLPESLRHNIPFEVGLMIVPTVLAMIWPLIRGTDARTWRLGLGWHTGRGFFREMGLGIIGYIAGVPIIAVGLFVMLVLIKLAHASPSHPINRMIGINNTVTLFVLALAGIYAPITEETMFRGAFFHALRGRHGWIFSAILSSFIFAAIHPQGWTVIPALMSIAIVFAGIREWRTTVVASATAHCLHNTTLVIFMLLAMS
jgi:membrane protease YdiL (CAAX protease family)